MAVPIVCGIETEYGIIVRGVAESNPIAASSTLVSAYVNELAAGGSGVGRPHRVGWDFEDENPANDARGGANPYSYAPEVESHLVNAVLTNGSRYYVDHAHPELSTPECRTAHEVLLYDRAGEEIMLRSMRAAAKSLPDGQEIVVYKNNSDGKGQSYGCHENYMLSRALPFGRLVNDSTAHFVSRQIFCGAGKVGTEVTGVRHDAVTFQISQRADFFEEEIGLETTLKRPIVNTRDEPHADSRKYRRFHVIVGDANMSEFATFLKVGTTALWMAVIDDDAAERRFTFETPVRALREVSTDLSLSAPLAMADGTTMTALEIQWELLRMCRNYADSHGLEAVGEDTGRAVLAGWEEVLEALESDPMSLADRIDWIAKYRLLNGYRERHDLPWNHSRLRAMDLQYHDLRPERSLARRSGLRTLVADEDVQHAMTVPPETTRAWFRGTCLSRFSDDIVSANWDSLVFDLGGPALRRVPMMEPTRGTRAHVGELLESVSTAAELVAKLAT